MNDTPNQHEERRRLEQLDSQALACHQLTRLNELLAKILPQNSFYAEKLAGVELPLKSLDDFAELPFTFKDELSTGRSGDVAANLTFARDRYSRFHQTSGTRGRPLPVLDTTEDWAWWNHCWQFVLDAAEIDASDIAMMAFSFGPFIGFWSAQEAVSSRGCLVVPGGGMNTLARLELLRTSQATCIFCTPTYALHMVEVAAENQIDVASLPIRRLIVAGEPGGSLPAIRSCIEEAWQAKVIDHSGATEVGAWGYGDAQGEGLYVLETEFIAELLSVETGTPATEGELAELVITSLGREGAPVIRYRTGDLARPRWDHNGETHFVQLAGGVLGRADDMMIIRGINIFPSSVEQILRSFPEVVEFRIRATKLGEMDQLIVEVEDRLDEPTRIAEELQLRLGLKIEVKSVDLGSLPRFEAKGKRFVDER